MVNFHAFLVALGHFLANHLNDFGETWSAVRQNGHKADAKKIEAKILSHSRDI